MFIGFCVAFERFEVLDTGELATCLNMEMSRLSVVSLRGWWPNSQLLEWNDARQKAVDFPLWSGKRDSPISSRGAKTPKNQR
jgi:hypothetical protein